MPNKTAIVSIPDVVILNKILIIRGKKVMLDIDMADLYSVETKRLNEQVKRNIKRFPDDFMFQVNDEEKKWIIEHIPHLNRLKFSSTLPFAFTEHGAVMLASILNSNRAIEVNIQIVRVFNRLKEALLDDANIRLELVEIKKKLESHGKNIELVFTYLDELIEKREPLPTRKRIGFKNID